jgi:hypothetical protein
MTTDDSRVNTATERTAVRGSSGREFQAVQAEQELTARAGMSTPEDLIRFWREGARTPCGSVQQIRSQTLRQCAEQLEAALAVSEGIRQQVEQYAKHKKGCVGRCECGHAAENHLSHIPGCKFCTCTAVRLKPCSCGLADLLKKEIPRDQSRVDGFPKLDQKSDLRDAQRGNPSDG